MQLERGGVEFEDLGLGGGPIIDRSTTVVVSYMLALCNGDVVQSDEGRRFRLGERRVVAGLEYGGKVMRVGGEKRIRVGPHLVYRDQEIPCVFPANAIPEFLVRLPS